MLYLLNVYKKRYVFQHIKFVYFGIIFYSIFFFFNNKATNSDTTTAIIRTKIKALSLPAKLPRDTFIPKKEEIMVGIDSTMVAAAKNFIAIFRLLDMIVAYVSVIEDKISL